MKARVADRIGAASLNALVRLLRALPEKRALALGAWVGRRYAGVGSSRTKVGRTNLRIAFPDWSEADREDVLRRSLEGMGQSLVEFARLAVLPPDELKARFSIEGWAHYERARDASPTGGIAAVTAHFGSWELLAAAMTAHGLPLAVVHRPRRPAYEPLVNELRLAGGSEGYRRGNAAREALQAIRDGKIVALPLDQNAPRRHGVFVPFFGQLACVREAPVRLAMRTRAPVVPAFAHRQPDGRHHVLCFRPPIELMHEGADRDALVLENARRMTAPIEAEIRRAPEQWMWVHRRWRTQPEGRYPY
jgi:KDO2-lipid IV(A) lauroyltransferase